MKKIFKNCRGSYTIEAILIMSTLIMVLSLLILSFMLIYHQTLLARTAAQVSQQAAAMWVRGEMGEGLYYRLLNDSLYREIVHYDEVLGQEDLKNYALGVKVLMGDRVLEEKFTAIERLVYTNLCKAIKKPQQTQVTVKYKNHILTRQLTVLVSQEMKIPFGRLKQFFDGKDTITLTASAAAEVTEPAEFIRNADLVLEYGTILKDEIRGRFPDGNAFLDFFRNLSLNG